MGKINLNLKQYKCVCLDTSLFIYFIEGDAPYVNVAREIFSEITFGNINGISSYLSLLEVLVKPIKEGAWGIAKQYKNLMMNSSYLKLYRLDGGVAEEAARLRAKYNGNGFKIRTPDAIQIATGILNHAEIFFTNDIQLKQVKDMNVVVLDDIV